jgi:hypothetical protein
MKTYVIDVDTSCTPEEGAHGQNWPYGLILIIIVIVVIIIIIIIIIPPSVPFISDWSVHKHHDPIG